MAHDTNYIVGSGEDMARALQRAGRWDDALAVLPADAAASRAPILADRFWWRLDDPAEAEAAAAVLAAHDPVLAQFCSAQLAYTRILFSLSTQPGDRDLARDGFTSASTDERLAGWGTFWLGVLADNLDDSPAEAIGAYTRALAWARQNSDWMLESYAVRHLGDHALENGDSSGLDLLRRSYHLRAALGARPHTAAAAATLSAAMPPGAEASQLHETAVVTARELQLNWLLNAL